MGRIITPNSVITINIGVNKKHELSTLLTTDNNATESTILVLGCANGMTIENDIQHTVAYIGTQNSQLKPDIGVITPGDSTTFNAGIYVFFT